MFGIINPLYMHDLSRPGENIWMEKIFGWFIGKLRLCLGRMRCGITPFHPYPYPPRLPGRKIRETGNKMATS